MSTKQILLFSLLFICLACSSVKVTDAWKSDSFSDIKNNKMLVVARTDNNQARIAFENRIVEELAKNGIEAKSSFSVFPTNIKMQKELTAENKLALEEFLKNEGFDGVIVSVIKDVQEITKTVTDGGYYAGSTFPRYYPGYYNGFFTFYYDPISYYSTGTYVDPTSTTYSTKTFILETVAYDLTKEDGQLIAVVTTQLENPSNLDKNAAVYTKKIVKALK